MRARTRLIGLVWPFIAVVLAQLLVASLSIYTLSAVRAYVAGESAWSKAQKDAIYHLHTYAESGDVRDFDRFAAAIAIPLADRDAHRAINSDEPDDHGATEAFLRAGIHPDDVPGMIWLYRTFAGVSHFSSAIASWAEADGLIAELNRFARSLRTEIEAGTLAPADVAACKAEIDRLNGRLAPLATDFSRNLGATARMVERLLLVANALAAALLILFAAWRMNRLFTQRRAFELALGSEKERLQVTLASIGDAVVSTDARGYVDFLNPAAEQLVGRRGAGVVGRPLRSLFSIVDEETGQEDAALLPRILLGEAVDTTTAPMLLVRTDGSRTPVSLSGAPLVLEGATAGAVIVLHDETREREYMSRLSWQASHDTLTDLANRREFERRLEKALAVPVERAGQHALIFLDLDQFKIVNDTCGHAAGDQLLRQVSAVIRADLRSGDLLARMGGDEFAILMENCTEDAAQSIAERLRDAIQAMKFVWNGRGFTITASIGLVHAVDRRLSLEETLQAADVACYMAKDKGRNRVQVHRPGDTELLQRFGEMAWVQRIRQAIDENRFCLFAQEIVALDPAEQKGVHVELLLRLRDEAGRLVMPGIFIPAAERYGLMPMIDRWVVRNALACLAERQAGDQPLATCAINLSGASLTDDAFADYVREQIAAHGVEPETLCFEITETSAIANLSSAMQFIGVLKALGCRFALDDFGTGMSSFAYLKQLPVDYLKIDGSFVRDMVHSRMDRAMVEMIGHIGQVTGKRIVAEFVEDEETMRALREIGIDYAQGYGISRPRRFDATALFTGASALPTEVEPLPVLNRRSA